MGKLTGIVSCQCETVDPEDVKALATAVKKALKVYRTPSFKKMIKACMAQDLSWKVTLFSRTSPNDNCLLHYSIVWHFPNKFLFSRTSMNDKSLLHYSIVCGIWPTRLSKFPSHVLCSYLRHSFALYVCLEYSWVLYIPLLFCGFLALKCMVVSGTRVLQGYGKMRSWDCKWKVPVQVRKVKRLLPKPKPMWLLLDLSKSPELTTF